MITGSTMDEALLNASMLSAVITEPREHSTHDLVAIATRISALWLIATAGQIPRIKLEDAAAHMVMDADSGTPPLIAAQRAIRHRVKSPHCEWPALGEETIDGLAKIAARSYERAVV